MFKFKSCNIIMATITLLFLPNQVEASFPIPGNHSLDHSGILLYQLSACLAHCEFTIGGFGIHISNIIITTVFENSGPYLSRQLLSPTECNYSVPNLEC